MRALFLRTQPENWQAVIVAIAFALIGLFFVVVVLRVLFMSQKKVDDLSKLPLENDELPREELPAEKLK